MINDPVLELYHVLRLDQAGYTISGVRDALKARGLAVIAGAQNVDIDGSNTRTAAEAHLDEHQRIGQFVDYHLPVAPHKA